MAKSMKYLGILTALAAIAPAANAATAPSQVRVAITPIASDPVWKTPGVKFEKAVECKVLKSTSPNPAFPAPADVLSTGEAKAPLFNPGLPKPDGTYSAGPNNGDNTIFVPLNLAVDPNSYVACAGRILANGVNVTASSRAGLTYATIMKIGGTGPIGVSPQLNSQSLQALVATLPKSGSFKLVFNHYLGSKPPSPSGPASYFDIDTGTSTTTPNGQSDFFIKGGQSFTPDSPEIGLMNGAAGSSALQKLTSISKFEPSLTQCKNLIYDRSRSFPSSTNYFLCFKSSTGKYVAIRYYSSSFVNVPNQTNDFYGRVYTYYFSYVIWP